MRFTPTTIIPSEFTYMDSYDTGGQEEPPFNLGACGRLIDESPIENFTNMSKCCVCGTRFRHGEVWRHDPTDQRICIGHQCAAKYGLMATDPAYKQRRATEIRKHKRVLERRAVRLQMKRFLANKRGLGPMLRTDHYIIRDIRAKLIRWGSVSPKTVALVTKIVREKAERDAAEGPLVPVVEGRYEMIGTVVSIKWQDNQFYNGVDTAKMLVLVDAEGGRYKVWGTMPEALTDQIMKLIDKDADEIEGLIEIVRRVKPRIRFTATVAAGDRDESFGFFKRPAKAEVLS